MNVAMIMFVVGAKECTVNNVKESIIATNVGNTFVLIVKRSDSALFAIGANAKSALVWNALNVGSYAVIVLKIWMLPILDAIVNAVEKVSVLTANMNDMKNQRRWIHVQAVSN